MITLGVADVDRARAFYERLGWRGQTVEQTTFFQVGGMALVLWAREKLAADAGLAGGVPTGFCGMALAHNVRSRRDVEDLVTAAEAAGATVTRRPADTSYGGYAGYFTDLDGYAWEVAYNPGLPLEQDGSVALPDFGAE